MTYKSISFKEVHATAAIWVHQVSITTIYMLTILEGMAGKRPFLYNCYKGKNLEPGAKGDGDFLLKR